MSNELSTPTNLPTELTRMYWESLGRGNDNPMDPAHPDPWDPTHPIRLDSFYKQEILPVLKDIAKAHTVIKYPLNRDNIVTRPYLVKKYINKFNLEISNILSNISLLIRNLIQLKKDTALLHNINERLGQRTWSTKKFFAHIDAAIAMAEQHQKALENFALFLIAKHKKVWKKDDAHFDRNTWTIKTTAAKNIPKLKDILHMEKKDKGIIKKVIGGIKRLINS